MTYEKILYERSGDVAIVRLNDPATLNALSTRLAEELLDAIERASEARALLVTGVGRAFCSGANLAEGDAGLDDPRRDIGRALDALLHPVVYAMRRLEIPVVAAVRGVAAGLGCTLALGADLIVAGEGAYFLQAFRHVGLAPDGGSSWLLAKAIGRTRAMEMMLLGERLPAVKALEWGLINRVVADEEVESAGLALAADLARGPRSLGLTKALAWAALDSSYETALTNERHAQRVAGRSDDFLEGVAAFREKRAPRFTGS